MDNAQQLVILQTIHELFMNWNDWGNYNFESGDHEYTTLGYDETLPEKEDATISIINEYNIPICTYTVDFEHKIKSGSISRPFFNQVCNLIPVLKNIVLNKMTNPDIKPNYFFSQNLKNKSCKQYCWVIYFNRCSGYNGDIPKALVFYSKDRAMKFWEENKDYCESYRNSKNEWTNKPEKIKIR